MHRICWLLSHSSLSFSLSLSLSLALSLSLFLSLSPTKFICPHTKAIIYSSFFSFLLFKGCVHPQSHPELWRGGGGFLPRNESADEWTSQVRTRVCARLIRDSIRTRVCGRGTRYSLRTLPGLEYLLFAIFIYRYTLIHVSPLLSSCTCKLSSLSLSSLLYFFFLLCTLALTHPHTHSFFLSFIDSSLKVRVPQELRLCPLREMPPWSALGHLSKVCN